MSLIVIALVAMLGHVDVPSLPHVEVKTCPVSWYKHGHIRADGGRFDPKSLVTVAHRTLPFGTKVLMVNSENGKWLVCEVQDRGPFVAGREFDLAEGVAKYLGVTDSPNQPKLSVCILPQKV